MFTEKKIFMNELVMLFVQIVVKYNTKSTENTDCVQCLYTHFMPF